MNSSWPIFAALLSLTGCSRSEGRPVAAASSEEQRANLGSSATEGAPNPPPKQGEALAYFAGGCFWGVEHYLEQMDGVLAVESGFMGGHVEAPAYEQVIGKQTGHLETVRVRYRPDVVSYEAIAQRFFEIHDPTQADGQGPDLGPQYLSAVFYGSPSEQRTAQQLIGQLRARGYNVVTELKPSKAFWLAEDYHQDYYKKTGKEPYCHRRIRRFDQPIVR